PGSPLTAWNTARSAGPTRPSDATTAQPANTARLAASTIRSRWMRLTAPGPPAVPALVPSEATRLPAGPEDLHHRPYNPGARPASARTTAIGPVAARVPPACPSQPAAAWTAWRKTLTRRP